MVKINTTKTFTVKPAEKTPAGRTIPLSVMDRVFYFPHYTSTVHIYRPSGPHCALDNAEALRESLSKVLVHFYLAAGRYVWVDEEEDIVAIDCNDEGVHFVQVETASVLDDLGHLSPSSDFKSLVPFIDISSQRTISSYPIMLVQATYFKCGAVALGITIEHRTVDGTAAFHLINSWAEVNRGLDVSVPPFLDRTALFCPRDPPRPKFHHSEYSPYPSSGDQIYDGETKVSVLRLTTGTINKMKAKANINQDGASYTTFEILAGHTWKCVCKARKVADDQSTRLIFPINARAGNRMDPPPPPGFFGNAILRVAPVVNAGDLQSKPLSFAAGTIRSALARMNCEYTKSVVDFLAIQPDLTGASFSPSILEPPNFHITSWVRLGLNDADFGWGHPVYSGPAEIKFEKAYIFSGDDHNGGELSLAMSLRPKHLEIFEKLFYEFV